MAMGWARPTIAAAIASAILAAQLPALAATPERETCFGINAKGRNDCRSGRHVCAGRSQIERDPVSFIWLPAGICEKIAGGSLTAKPG